MRDNYDLPLKTEKESKYEQHSSKNWIFKKILFNF
jgi:hypothetical protein